MPLKTVIDTTEGLDEAIAALYTEADGRFVLDIEGVDDHPEVANLKSAYNRTKEGLSAIKAEAAQLKSEIADLKSGAPDTAATQARIAELQERLAEKEAEAGNWRTKYTGITRDQSLRNALLGAKVGEDFIEAAIALISTKHKVEVDESGNTFIDAGMGPRSVSDFAKAWVAKEGAAFVPEPKGGGAKGGQGGSDMKPSGSLAGSKDERKAALKAKFPDLG